MRAALCSLAVLFALGWLFYVWPTPWNYYKQGKWNLRVNRFTGELQYLNQYGWHVAKELSDADVGLTPVPARVTGYEDLIPAK